MAISLGEETQKLIEDRMKAWGTDSADDVVRAAIRALDAMEATEPDDQTWAAIERADGQYERGAGIEVGQAFEQIRRKHFGS